DVEAFRPVDGDQRRLDQLLVHLVREVGLQAAAVEVELAGAGYQTDPHHGFLAAADGLDRTLDDDVVPRGRRCGPDGPRRLDDFFDHDLGLSSCGLSSCGLSSCGLCHWATCLISYGVGC